LADGGGESSGLSGKRGLVEGGKKFQEKIDGKNYLKII